MQIRICRYNVHEKLHYSEECKKNVGGSINTKSISSLKWYSVSSKQMVKGHVQFISLKEAFFAISQVPRGLRLYLSCLCCTPAPNIGEGDSTPLQYSCLENPMDGGAWQAAVHGVAQSQTRLSDFTFTFHFHALEKEMATYSTVLAWRIPGTGEPGGLLSMGSHRVGHD